MTDRPRHLVTGATGNLGRATATLLAGSGARIAAADRDGTVLATFLAGLPGTGHVALPGVDLTNPAACVGLVAEARDGLGGLDGVVHTVGGFAMARAEDGGNDLWESMFRLNAMTVVNVLRAAIPVLRAGGGGSMVAVSAGAGLKAGLGMGAYSAAKAAVLRAVEAFAAETGPHGVRVNAVLPGTIDTPQNRASMPGADTSGWVQPGEIAAVIAFLLSPGASAVNGAGIPVMGRG